MIQIRYTGLKGLEPKGILSICAGYEIEVAPDHYEEFTADVMRWAEFELKLLDEPIDELVLVGAMRMLVFLKTEYQDYGV